MNKVLEFPKHKIVREIPANVEEIEKAKEKGKQKFADEISYDLSGNIYDALESYGIDTESNEFDKDFALAVDMLKATIYRSMGIKHHLHSFVDNHVSLLQLQEDGKLVNLENGEEVDDIILEKINKSEIDRDI